ncbi:AraC family transcriptional regulator [Prevotella sp. P2-180]|uniref:helix-turn-helix domain-containing protein n=1 Tax=Prevotella sp. P2-180 TaxID=2024224 RepID=UPI0015517FC2|nr:helix-turn-helix domain-containing protein [Prevotella sp. P2-180]
MMRLLFYTTIFLAFSYIKDSVFLFAQWKNSFWLDDFVNTVDLLFIPLVCAFFIEATNPGYPTRRQLVALLSMQALFIPLFLIFPDEIVVFCAFSVAFVVAVATMYLVVVFSVRYRQYIKLNYSYKENIDVAWVVVSSVAFFLSLFVYNLAFAHTTWLSEALYNIFSMALWTFLFLFSRRHRVVRILKPVENEDEQATEEIEEPKSDDDVVSHNYILAVRLEQKMSQDKLYLNPKLTTTDVATAIGTNKTYLSNYLNNTLNTSFFDYINTFRINEACRIIEMMPERGRKSMSVVAQKSGFNSLSSFNRYFVKLKGISPKSYYVNSLMKNN